MVVGLYGKVLPNQNGAPLRIHSPVEVRLQERQVDRAHPLHRQAAADDVGDLGAERVRVLRERESDRVASALEPGAREPAARVPQEHADADVQRLRDQVASLYTGMDLRRTSDHGARLWRGLSSGLAAIVNSRFFKPAVFLACLAPGVLLGCRLYLVLTGQTPRRSARIPPRSCCTRPAATRWRSCSSR